MMQRVRSQMQASSSQPPAHQGELLYSKIANELEKGAEDRAHPFHLISCASLGMDGWPKVRMVVLRQFLREERLLFFHSDRRSPKIAEIRENPKISLMCYDAQEKTQLRMAAIAHLHLDDAITQARWLASPVYSKRCYLTPLPPSTPIESPRAFDFLHVPWNEATDNQARRNFCVVSCKIFAIDHLELQALGHQRTNLLWDDDQLLAVQPLMP